MITSIDIKKSYAKIANIHIILKISKIKNETKVILKKLYKT